MISQFRKDCWAIMKKFQIKYILILLFLAAAFTGCGDGSEESSAGTSTEVAVIEGEPVRSDTETEIMNYEAKYSTGEFTMEDYQALAALYGEAGQIRSQRDMLEQSFRLYEDAQAFETLQQIAVNLDEENEKIRTEAQTMQQNLELSEYQGEAIHMIAGDEWLDTMMPKLYQGKRSYFAQQDGRIAFSVEAGFEDGGVPFSRVWFVNGENQVTLLSRSGRVIQLMTVGLSEGLYNGAFEMWTMDSANGDIYQEQGTFANGILTGDYTARVHEGQAAGDAFDLWNNREGMEYTVYTGSFDGEGKTTVEQPTDSELAQLLKNTESVDAVVFARGEEERDCLFLEVSDGTEAAEFVFNAEALGIASYPAFTLYEVQKSDETAPAGEQDTLTDDNTEETRTADNTAAEETQPLVRIFDGELQYFDGEGWVAVGDIQSLREKDPFLAYAQAREAFLEEIRSQEAVQKSSGRRLGTGTISSGGSGTASSSQGASGGSGTSGGSSGAAAPSAPSQTAPDSTPSQDSGGGASGGGSTGGSTDSGASGGGSTGGSTDSGASGGGSTGGSTDSGTSGGGDVDIEWSPDIL